MQISGEGVEDLVGGLVPDERSRAVVPVGDAGDMPTWRARSRVDQWVATP
jgi:hypothetical protein